MNAKTKYINFVKTELLAQRLDRANYPILFFAFYQ